MTTPLWYPGAERDPVPDHPGKAWAGGSGKHRLVLHTLEYKRWPSKTGTWACPHITYNPWTQEARQHVPFNKAAYSLRDNANEDDAYTWQVELWGRAAEVPDYDDAWYEGVAVLVQWFQRNLGVPDAYPAVWLGSGSGAASATSPVRLKDDQWDRFAGVLGHQHFGYGIDTHWDPGALDIVKMRSFMTSNWANDITDASWMNMFHSGVPGIKGFGRYYCSNDGTVDWETETYEGLAAPWGSNPHWNEDTQRGAKDGTTTYPEKVNALNYLFQGFAKAAGDGSYVWANPWESGLN